MANLIYIFSHSDFDKYCENQEWYDSNVESLNDCAFISIIGTKACRKEYLHDEQGHWFKEPHPNVLNLEFDDLEKDYIWHGHTFEAMKEEDAIKCVEFIENNIGKDFCIHCKAGQSRSQAFFRFMVDFYNDVYTEDCGRKENPCVSPNMHVIRLLKRAFYQRHGMFSE